MGFNHFDGEGRAHMVDVGDKDVTDRRATAEATVHTPCGRVEYRGETVIAGVPRPAAPIAIAFDGTEGSSSGALLPTGQVRDQVAGHEVTLIDNGMPVVLIDAAALGLTGNEASMSEHWSEFGWVYFFAFAIGFSTTMAEPSLNSNRVVSVCW